MSVVIPVRNGASTLAAQLDALARATPPSEMFEVVIADNGSTDSTPEIAESFADRLTIRVVDAGQAQGAGATRNCGVAATQSDWLLFCDADDEVDQDWLRHMAAAFSAGHELIAGPLDYRRLNPPHICAWRGATRSSVMNMVGFLPAAPTANLGVTRRVFEAVNGFDTDFRAAGEDIAFCWSAQLGGAPLNEAPEAIVHYRLRSRLPELWKQSVSYGACEPLLYKKFAAAGMPRRPARALPSSIWWLLSRLPRAWPIGRRGAWVRRAGEQYGRVAGAFTHRMRWW